MHTKSKTGATDSSRAAKPPAKKARVLTRRKPRRRQATSADAERALKPSAPDRAQVGDKMGRPVRPFDPVAASEIVDFAKAGLPMRLACLGTCSIDVLVRWMDEKPDFAVSLQKARRDFASHTLALLSDGKAGTWQREAWKLERLYPEYFGLKAEIKHENTAKPEVSATVCAEISESWKQFESSVRAALETEQKVVDV